VKLSRKIIQIKLTVFFSKWMIRTRSKWVKTFSLKYPEGIEGCASADSCLTIEQYTLRSEWPCPVTPRAASLARKRLPEACQMAVLSLPDRVTCVSFQCQHAFTEMLSPIHAQSGMGLLNV
jgi:hypothetical protein